MHSKNPPKVDSSPGSPDPASVLLLWSRADDRGLARLGADLAAVLRSSATPDPLTVTSFDIAERMGALSLARSLVSALGGARSEAAMVASLLAGDLTRELRGRSPAAVVALDPTAAIIAERWSDKGLFRAPVLGVTSGLYLDPSWRKHVDRLLVADETQAAQAVQAGFAASDAQVVGALAGPTFAAAGKQSRGVLRERFGVPAEPPVVLFAVAGVDELTALLFQLTLLSRPCTPLFDADDDTEAAELLRRRARGFGVQARLFGRVDEAAELWACADVVVARPTPRHERRALYLRQALVALCDDAEDLATAEQHRSRGRGRVVGKTSALASELDAQLARLESDEGRASLAAQPRGELAALARAVQEVISAGPELLARRAIARRGPAATASVAAEAASPASPGSPASTERRSPLELIGVTDGGPAGPAATAAALAELAAEEAEANQRVTERQNEVARWEARVALARERGQSELAAEAERELELQRGAMHRALADLARLDERQRGRPVRPQVRGARVEADFKRMEVDSALEALKRRLGRD